MTSYLQTLKPSELRAFISTGKGILDSLVSYDDLSTLPPEIAGTVEPMYIDGIWFKRDGKKFTPRGVSLCHIKTDWGTHYQEIIDQLLLEPNIDIVRVPAHDGDMKTGSFLEDRYYPAVQQLIDAGKYVIIDCHPINNWDNANAFDMVYEWMEKVAKHFRNCPNIMFEFYNEPIGPTDDTLENWLNFRDMYQPVIDMIRHYAPSNIILCGNPSWSTRIKFAADYPFRGDNLAYVRHLYPNHTTNVSSFLNQEMPIDRLAIAVTEVGFSEGTGDHHDISHNPDFPQQTQEFFENNPQIMQIYWAYDDGCKPAMLAPHGATQRAWMNNILASPVEYIEAISGASDIDGLVYEYNEGDADLIADANLTSEEYTLVFKAHAAAVTQDKRLFQSTPLDIIRKGGSNRITIRYTGSSTSYINASYDIPDGTDFWLIVKIKPSGFTVEYLGQDELTDTNNQTNGVTFNEMKIGQAASWYGNAHNLYIYDRLITADDKEKILNFWGMI